MEKHEKMVKNIWSYGERKTYGKKTYGEKHMVKHIW